MDDIITLGWCVVAVAAMFGHVFPVTSQAYTTTLMQQFSVSEEQPAGTLIGRVAGVRPPFKTYFRADSDSERDLTVSESDGSITAMCRIDREALDPASSAQYRFEVASAADNATVTVTVFVADINDHAPTFPDDVVELTVSEAAPLDLRLSLLPAVDRDVGTNAVQVGLLYISKDLFAYRIYDSFFEQQLTTRTRPTQPSVPPG